MGRLEYGFTGLVVEIEDRPLAHLKVVILSKLRRHEGVAFTWEQGGGGRSTIWLHPAIPLRFVFVGSRPAVLNEKWLEELAVQANSTGGLRLSREREE